jgi:hypothetical protein
VSVRGSDEEAAEAAEAAFENVNPLQTDPVEVG